MEWFPHPLPTYTIYLRSCIWRGWVDGLTIMQLPQELSNTIWEFGRNPGTQLTHKWYCGTAVEAHNPHEMVLALTANIYNEYAIIHIAWMGRWTHHHAVTTLAGNVGDMLATRLNVAHFCPERPILATWFLVCRHTFLS
jgi:hypothetical protein